MEKKCIGVGLMGFGVIGSQVGRVLLERGTYPNRPAAMLSCAELR